MQKFVIFLIGLCVGISFAGFTADKSSEKVAVDSVILAIENQINDLSKQLYSIRRNDTLSIALSDSILTLLSDTYANNDAFSHSFDSLKHIGKIESEKSEVRIFTWNIVLKNGEYKYYGFIHYNRKGIQKYFALNDNSDQITEELLLTLSADNWYGANYYEIIESKTSHGTYYLLLGWHGHDLHLNKKVVETLYFTESGNPKFGKALLKVQRKKYKRIIFQYSRMANMLLTYNKDLEMIVMDHLSPPSSVQIGDYQSYGPDLSYDGLIFNGEFWDYKENIDYKRSTKKKRKR